VRLKTIRASVVAGIAALAVIGMAVPAQAGPASPAAPASQAELAAVSCLGSAWCMAVGEHSTAHGTHSLAQVWSNGSWRVLKDPPGTGLVTVSCVSRSFCMAGGKYNIDGPGGRHTPTALWNGSGWKSLTGPKNESTPLSCGSAKLCMTINFFPIRGSGPIVQAWNGRTWLSYPSQTSVCPPGQGQCGLYDVSCGSAANCVGVGYTTYDSAGDVRPEAVMWNGSAWTTAVPPGGQPSQEPSYRDVACTGTFCLALGYAGSPSTGRDSTLVASYDAVTGTWTQQHSGQPVGSRCGLVCFPPGSLSCGSPVNCMEFSRYGDLAWTGGKLNPAPPVPAGRGSELGAVACGRNYCLAVGYRTVKGMIRTLAEERKNSRWKILATPDLAS
jgi:hypothetical protein